MKKADLCCVVLISHVHVHIYMYICTCTHMYAYTYMYRCTFNMIVHVYAHTFTIHMRSGLCSSARLLVSRELRASRNSLATVERSGCTNTGVYELNILNIV